MMHRERIQAALAFERPDRLPCHETPWEQTLAAWREQGLPEEVSLEDYFGFDLSFMYLDVSPRFEQRVLRREDGMITYEDRFGYTIHKPEGISSTLEFLSHKTADEQAWAAVKPRFRFRDDLNEAARLDDTSYFGHFAPYPSWTEAKGKYACVRAANRFLLFACYGPWEATWRHRGLERLLMDVALSPDWVRDMAETYQALVLATLRHCLRLGLKPDGMFIVEDLGAGFGPLMSPKIWRQIFKPLMIQLGEFLTAQGITFWLHSDGNILLQIDDLIECGVQVLNPVEVKAGLDAVELRRRYGQRLAFFGNIAATKMSGPLPELEAELRRKVPLAREGGYILHSDHSCPPEVTFERYCWLHKTAMRIFEEAA
jgi:uroporphyrinogen decarboxylase